MKTRKKIAIITGASSGMGKDFAIELCKKYNNFDEFWLIARRKDRLLTLSNSIYVKSVIFIGDLTNQDFINEISAKLKESNPIVKVLVNAAGYGKIGHVDELPYDEQLNMLSLNCNALTSLTILCLPYMHTNSKIINIASIAAFLPQPSFAIYAASKSYVLSFTRALNVELKKRKISAIAVCPGPVDTEFFDIAEQHKKRAWYKNIFMSHSKDVIRQALKDLSAGKDTSIYSLPMKIFSIVVRLLPAKLFMKYCDNNKR